MSIPTPATPPMTPRFREFLYGALGWVGVLAFLAFVGYAAVPDAEIPSWLNIANAVINGANLVFFVAKNNVRAE